MILDAEAAGASPPRQPQGLPMPDLSALLAPRSVAIVGAAPAGQGLRGRIVEIMRMHPYAGAVYPVSRSHAEVQGLRAYASVADIPGQVDLAVLIIPAGHVLAELERCGKAGVKAAAIISSGFAEEEGGAGAANQAQLAAIARAYDMAVLGPNSEGFANLPLSLCPTFSPAVAETVVPLIPPGKPRARIAVVAQSGGMGFAFYDRGRPKQLAFSHIVTTGNEAALEIFDVVEHLVDRDEADLFLLLIEDVKTPATMRRAAAKALAAGKPILAVKIGRSEAGTRAAKSHTAALAGSYDAFQAEARRLGIVEGRDIDELVDMAQAFVAWKDLLPAGRRIAVCTASGGGGGLMADTLTAEGLELPLIDAETRARIDAHLPSYGSSQNPIDGTAQAIRSIGYHGMARLAVSSPVVDAAVVVMSGRAAAHLEHERADLTRLARETAKPIMLWSYTLPVPRSVEIISEAGLPLYTSLGNVARSLRALLTWKEAREAAREAEPSWSPPPQAKERARAMLLAGGPILAEWPARQALAPYGIGTDDGSVLAGNAREAVAAWQRIGRPVALKVQSPDVPHKTEAGALALGLASAEAISASFEQVLASALHFKPGARIEGILVQPMAAKGVEMILGIKCDERFGPMLVVGLGGVLVEVMGDAVLAPVPLCESEARAMLARLRGRRLLDGVRGAPPADVAALADVMVRLARFGADHADLVREIDLNPVIVHPAGKGITIVDALIVIAGPGNS